jgi:arylsulfatase A-like enzyme
MDTTETTKGFRVRRVLAMATGIVLLATLAVAGPAGTTAAIGGGGSPRGVSGQPNIVLILSDDQRWDTLDWMPNVQHLLVDHGVTFTQAYVGNSLCCPSRVTILTGEHSHTTRVWSNQWPYGGFRVFHDSGGERSTIATWLQAAGYHTALIGKYLNEYEVAARQGYFPPGWDEWDAFVHPDHVNYDLTINGRIEPHYGPVATDFSTDVLADKAVSFIQRTKGPLFMYFAPYAPHGPYDVTPAQDACGPLGQYDSPSYGEKDVTDKPPYVATAPWSSDQVRQTGSIRSGQCALIRGVDRSVGRIVSALQATNRLSNTMIVYMSDNGYMWGEHRLFHKSKPYDEAGHIPMVVRYDPWTKSPRSDSRLVLNLDIAQTFAALAHTNAPGGEGRSLLPLIAGKPVDSWRNAFLLEHSYGSDDEAHHAPDYCGVRTTNWMYTMYMWGAEELYDLRADPAEMNNVVDLPSAQAKRTELRNWVFAHCKPLPPRFPTR